jgi:hypothetical protein
MLAFWEMASEFVSAGSEIAARARRPYMLGGKYKLGP